MRDVGAADDNAFAEFLINEAGVAVVPGSAFGAPGHMRLSFATATETLKDALARMQRALAGARAAMRA
jgi:aspartate aminotransferase